MEDICDHKTLSVKHLFVLDIWRLVLFVRLAKELAHLMEEAITVSQFAPSLDAHDQVESALTTQLLGQINLSASTSRNIAESSSELSFDAVVAYNGAGRKPSLQKFEIASLSMADVKDAESFQAVESSGPKRRIVVHL